VQVTAPAPGAGRQFCLKVDGSAPSDGANDEITALYPAILRKQPSTRISHVGLALPPSLHSFIASQVCSHQAFPQPPMIRHKEMQQLMIRSCASIARRTVERMRERYRFLIRSLFLPLLRQLSNYCLQILIHLRRLHVNHFTIVIMLKLCLFPGLLGGDFARVVQ